MVQVFLYSLFNEISFDDIFYTWWPMAFTSLNECDGRFFLLSDLLFITWGMFFWCHVTPDGYVFYSFFFTKIQLQVERCVSPFQKPIQPFWLKRRVFFFLCCSFRPFLAAPGGFRCVVVGVPKEMMTSLKFIGPQTVGEWLLVCRPLFWMRPSRWPGARALGICFADETHAPRLTAKGQQTK